MFDIFLCIWYNINMEKDMFNIIKMNFHMVEDMCIPLQYHLVWCTKYRKKVLKDGIDTECKEMLRILQKNINFRSWQWRLCRIISICL